MQSTSNEPLIQASALSMTDDGSGLDLADVALLECLLDEALAHLSKVLTLLPDDNRKASNARTFLAQFRQP